jgi:hypothetical protein
VSKQLPAIFLYFYPSSIPLPCYTLLWSKEMGIREEIQKKLDKKEEEKWNLLEQVNTCDISIATLQEVLKMLPREAEPGKERSLRPGTAVALARDAIRKAGKPLHIGELLVALGKPDAKKHRLALSGSLATYVRRGEIFTRPEPNTFGLLEFRLNGEQDRADPLESLRGEPTK